MKSAIVKAGVPLFVAALMLAGCSAGGSPEPTDTDTETEASGTLRVNFGQFPENWAPGQENEGGLIRIPYETLLSRGPQGTIEPWLATEWELTSESLTLTLRDDVVFHDGEPFNAEAVKANIEYIQSNPTPYSGPVQVISEVEAVDETTVVLHLSSPTPSLPTTLTTRVAPMGSPAAIADGSITTAPVGTSPWAYDESASVAGTRMHFAQFDDYWGETPGFANIDLFAIPEDQAASGALVAGEIDITDSEMTEFPAFENTPIEYFDYPAIRNNLFFFDRGPDGLFADVNLRQAVCYAIDVPQMIQVTGEGEAATQHFAEGELGYNADITGYPTDLDEAQSLYAAAGSPSINTEMVAAPYNAQQIEIYMDQASQIGDFTVTVNTLPPPQFNSEWNAGRYPLGLGSNDELTPFDWYKSWFAADAPGNPSGTESPALKAAADAAIAAGDSDEATALWAEVTKVIADEALTCGHARGVEIIAYNSDTVAGAAAPAEPWEPNSINYRDLRPAG